MTQLGSQFSVPRTSVNWAVVKTKEEAVESTSRSMSQVLAAV
jgi:hypothetical protein